MNVKPIILQDADTTLSNPAKRAMLSMASNQDRYRDGPGWQSIANLSLGQAVEAVNHFGRHETALGDVLAVHALNVKRPVIYAQVQQIILVQCDQLSDTQIADLGFVDRQAYVETDGDRLGNHRAWLVYFERVALPPSGDAVN